MIIIIRVKPLLLMLVLMEIIVVVVMMMITMTMTAKSMIVEKITPPSPGKTRHMLFLVDWQRQRTTR